MQPPWAHAGVASQLPICPAAFTNRFRVPGDHFAMGHAKFKHPGPFIAMNPVGVPCMFAGLRVRLRSGIERIWPEGCVRYWKSREANPFQHSACYDGYRWNLGPRARKLRCIHTQECTSQERNRSPKAWQSIHIISSLQSANRSRESSYSPAYRS